MTAKPHIVKLGGSLLSQPDAHAKLADWLARFRQANCETHPVLILGGGEPVEWLRRLDRQHPLSNEAAHWAAIRMMDANAIVVADWLAGVALESDWRRLQQRANASGATLFAAERFLREVEPKLPGTRLPIGWQVTSDSIAARVALALRAPLTLVKSAKFPTPSTREGWQALAKRGVVDLFLPRLVDELPSVQLAAIDATHHAV